jgi:hypothetical protein
MLDECIHECMQVLLDLMIGLMRFVFHGSLQPKQCACVEIPKSHRESLKETRCIVCLIT